MIRLRGAALWLSACGLLVTAGCGRRLPPDQPANAKVAEEIRLALMEGAAEGGQQEVKAEPTGFATLVGSFKFATADIGKIAPPPALAIVGGDAAVCAPGGGPVLARSLLFNKATGGIQNVVIFLNDNIPNNEKWMAPSAAPGKKEPVVFDQKSCLFLSPLLVMQASQPIEIRNSDPIGHNTKMGNFNRTIPPGGQDTYVFGREERSPVRVVCSIHPWMSAYMLPRNNGYFAVTDANGNFKIENLPAGVELTFKAWQEKSGFLQDVKVNGKGEKWSRRGFPQTLTAGEEKKFDVVVDAGPFSN